MKKIYFLLLFVFTSLFIISFDYKGKADGSETILYKYGTTTPITYYGTTNPVTIPTHMHYSKQELRGVWIATIWNLDMPAHTSQTQYKAEFIKILDTLEAYNMNALFFQVRPKNDAMYESQLNPWSRFLTGTEGVNPGWDPLPWMIDEAHKRGIEFHAWFNPFRVFVSGLSSNNFAAVHPEYVIYPGTAGDEMLNPGEPAVRQHIIDTVMEVANKYNIDGVHFDDYFYPYGGLAADKDAAQYVNYNPLGLTLADWRRENVNDVVFRVKEGLSQVNLNQNKSIQFGISPFGVWANKNVNPLGSNTVSGVQSYSEQYADSRRWIKEEWVDYIIPQVYWEFTEPNAQYADVVNWWVDQVKGTDVNLYIGNSIYRYKENGWNSGPWADPYEIDHQLLYNSKFPEITGSVYFRYKYLIDTTNTNLVNAQNRIKTNFYSYEVLTPSVKNIDSIPPMAPENLVLTNNTLTWNRDLDAKAYYVYRFNEGEIINLQDITKVIDIIYPITSTVSFTDSTAITGARYTYYVTAFDKVSNESAPSSIANYSLVAEIKNTHDFTLELGSSTPDYLNGISAYDSNGNNITSTLVVNDGLVNLNQLGTYPLTYSATELNGNVITKTVNVTVVYDLTSPVISGTKNLTVEVKTTANYQSGVSVTDNRDSQVSLVVDSSLVNINVLGTYPLTYSAMDASGNQTTVTVSVYVVDTTKPVIIGAKNITIKLRTNYNYLAGISATDNYDTNLTVTADSSQVNNKRTGTYPLTYRCVDSSGNVTTITVYVTVTR